MDLDTTYSHAGYALGAVLDHARAEGHGAALGELCVAAVSVDRSARPIDASVWAVVDNLVSRGLPALASPRVEAALADALGLTQVSDDPHVVAYGPTAGWGDRETDFLARALAVVDPRVPDRLPHALPELGSPAEAAFWERGLAAAAGPWVCQWVELQRPVTTLLDDEKGEFAGQRVDFSVEWPTNPADGSPTGVVVEIDGGQHESPPQKHLDAKRDAALKKAGWADTVRIAAKEAAAPPREAVSALGDVFSHPHAERLAENWSRPLWTTPGGLRWLQLALVPLAVARVQKAVARLVLDGHLDPAAERWSLAVVERDVPCARLAVDDLLDLVGHLLDLEGRGRRAPQVELRVYRTAEFEGCELACDGAELYDPGGAVAAFDADAVVDVSVLQRPGFSELGGPFRARVAPSGAAVGVRTAYSPRGERRVTPGPAVVYGGAGEDGDPAPPALEYLLHLLFRKRAFRERQVDVVRPALQGRSVAGILPTGAGKSLCYQMAGLLQPGVTLVVAPLKSLMRDQDANLRRAGIDATAFVNSSLTGKQKAAAQAALRRGAYQFAFVSPERFLIREFRDTLRDLEVPVAYAVVDEAHCVSEWGHDFRTAYLRLGQNVRAHARSAWPRGDGPAALPVVALTGTASFDVLADVRRELGFGDEVPTVLPESFEREELAFEIVPVPAPHLEGTEDYWGVRNAVLEQKMDALGRVVGALPDAFGADPDAFFELDGPRTRSGIVFTPHANGSLGVRKLMGEIETRVGALAGAVDCYASSDDLSSDADLDRAQERFKDDEVGLLVATKAFGMGIDKPNIRYVVHLNISQSIESYYQEAGRAGRDRDPARCYVLYCPQPAGWEEGAPTVDRELMLYFHELSFAGPAADLGALDEVLTGGARPWRSSAEDLDALLREMEPGDVRAVVVPFENDVVGPLAEYLQGRVDPKLKAAVIGPAMPRAEDLDDLLARVSRATGGAVSVADLTPHRAAIGRVWDRRRDEKATFRAVYRLSTIGLVDDYIVDYGGRAVVAKVRRRTALEHVEAVRDYVARYKAPEFVRRVPDEVMARIPERGVVRACLDYLVGFVYGEIAAKRFEAISQMEGAVRDGVERGPEAFQRYVNTYFDSRYTEPLRARLGDGLADYDLDLVWEFIEATEGADDDVQHLRGACDRLLVAAPDNGALLLLRAFARSLSRGGDPSAFDDDFERGWAQFRDLKGLDHRGHVAGLGRFHDLVARYDREAVGPVGASIARAHAGWVRDLNRHLTPPEPHGDAPPEPEPAARRDG